MAAGGVPAVGRQFIVDYGVMRAVADNPARASSDFFIGAAECVAFALFLGLVDAGCAAAEQLGQQPAEMTPVEITTGQSVI